ncbi:xylose isomerase-like protein, partial [Geopyxis carbonaria]
IATVSLPGTLESKLHACAAAGFTHIELFEDDVLRYPHPLPQLRKLCYDLGLNICMYQPFRDLGEWALRSDFDLALERLRHKFRWMDDLGCDTILVVSNCQPANLCTDNLETSISQYKEAAEVAARHGKRIVFEALAWGTHINLWRQSWEIVRAVDHPAFGLCLDSFHIYSRGDNVDGLGDVPAEKIFIVQLADAPYLQMHVLEWSRHYRSFPGQGEMPITEFMEELRKTGYDGIVSLEVFSDNIRNGNLPELAKDAMRSLQFLDG